VPSGTPTHAVLGSEVAAFYLLDSPKFEGESSCASSEAHPELFEIGSDSATFKWSLQCSFDSPNSFTFSLGLQFLFPCGSYSKSLQP